MATVSADSTVKLWDFGKGIATATFTEHTHCVWSCEFNHTGTDLITGSMDNTAKLWDLKRYKLIKSQKCKHTFRGHSESVNHVGYQPFSSIIYTCSSDKTVSFWDSRTGICNQTLFGHKNTINHGVFSLNVQFD
jgi:WD40 repeat protein